MGIKYNNQLDVGDGQQPGSGVKLGIRVRKVGAELKLRARSSWLLNVAYGGFTY